MFDEGAAASRWTIRLVKFSVAAAAVVLLGWWASQVFGWRVSKPKSPVEQVAILRNHAERPFVRRVAAESLERSEASIADELTAELSAGDAVGRELAAFALARLGVPPLGAVDALIAALDDSELDVRRQAAIALGRIGARPKEVAAAMTRSLRGDGLEIRGEIITALRRLGPEGIEILPGLLADADADVRRRAVIELGRAESGDSDIVDGLRGRLGDPDPRVRAEAYAALGRHSAIGIEELIAALHDADSSVQSTACTLLGRAGGEAEPAIADLAALLAHRDFAAETAIWALTQIGNEHPERIALLAPLMDSDDERTAENAIRLLAGFGRIHRDIYARLLEHADDPRRGIGSFVLNALHDAGLEGRLRPPELIAALGEAEDEVQSLVLWNTNAEPPGRGRSRNRRERFMRGYGIDDRELSRLAGLRKLRLLDLRENPVGDSGLHSIAAFERLERLTLAQTQITSAGLAHLSGLAALRSLSLAGCEIDDAGLEHLKNLSSLEYLNLDDTRVTDAGLERLAGLTKLKRLGLRGTKATDAGLLHIARLTQLESLQLDDTAITDAGLAELRTLAHLKILTLARTRTTVQGLETLHGALSQLETRFGPDQLRWPARSKPYEVDGLEAWETPDSAPSDRRMAAQSVGG